MNDFLASRLKDLRHIMTKSKVDYFLVPMSDENQTEYVPHDARRLRYITGFSGSAGFAIIGLKTAVLFVDGRYTLQAKQEVSEQLFEHHDLHGYPPHSWLSEKVQPHEVIGVDGWLITQKQFEAFQSSTKEKKVTIKNVEQNFIDQIWHNKPEKIVTPIEEHPLEYSGVSHTQKITNLAAKLNEKKVDAVFISLLDSIAWLFNIRAQDIPQHPMVRGYALLNAQGKAKLFVNKNQIQPVLSKFLGDDIKLIDLTKMTEHLQQEKMAHIWLDKTTVPHQVWNLFEKENARIYDDIDPCQYPKAIKNKAESNGAKHAHIQDGAALCQYFAWLYRSVPFKPISECEAADQLETFRKKREKFKSISFTTISAADDHGAIVHYSPQAETQNNITAQSIYLVDSGGHYLNGTTDVTRTLCFGTPSQEQKDRYTRVLKGHIALSQVIFPKGTSGKALDCLARQYLWQIGADFKHGTGHGVGSYLCVHEGPQNFGRNIALETGMIISNEPGFYKEGAYGIRIENLIIVTESSYEGFYGFETLTLAPYDHKLMDLSLLTADEIDWINTYHQRVWEEISPLVDVDTKDWLREATNAITI